MAERKKSHKYEKSATTQVSLGLLNGFLPHQLLKSNMVSDPRPAVPIFKAFFRYYYQ